tara:strand:+ start:574 stop:1227 length:654 start_codon:yes stop_codon:yes gene_type:complete
MTQNYFDQFDTVEEIDTTTDNVEVGKAILDSGKSQFGEAELKKAAYAVTMDEATLTINNIESKSDLSTFMSEMTGIVGAYDDYLKGSSVESPWMRNLMTEDFRRYDAASRAWVMAHLRDVSGAAVPAEEVYNGQLTFFPVVGDEQAEIDDKRRARRVLQVAMREAGGNAYKKSATAVAIDKGYDDPDLTDKIKQRAREDAEFKKKAIEKGLLPKDFK